MEDYDNSIVVPPPPPEYIDNRSEIQILLGNMAVVYFGLIYKIQDERVPETVDSAFDNL